jgi:hypothetical protein
MICPPRCRMGTITPEERNIIMSRSPVSGRYDTPVNRESALEILSRRTISPKESSEKTTAEQSPAGGSMLGDFLWGTKRRQGMVETMAKQAARTVGSQVGRQILRGLLGGILGGTRRR